MKKIITAIDNPKLNEKLKKEKNINIIGKDIQYKEGIIELLEKNKEIDMLIISENIPGEISVQKLIERINDINKKINIIYILEKEDNEKEKILKSYNITNIYYNKKITIEEIIKIIKEKNKEKEMEEEIEKLKKIIQEKNKIKNNKFLKIKKNIKEKYKRNFLKKIHEKTIKNKKIKYNSKNKEKLIENKIETKYKKEYGKIFNIIGNKKSEKIKISINIGYNLSKENNKVLFIDLDFNKKNLTNILLEKQELDMKKKYLNKNYKFQKSYIEKIEKNIFLMRTDSKVINEKLFLKKVENYMDFFDYIIVDTDNNYRSKIIERGCKNIIIAEAKILEIKEIKEVIEKIREIGKFCENNLHIIITGINKDSIMKEIIRKIFEDIRIILFIKNNQFFRKYNFKKIFKI